MGQNTSNDILCESAQQICSQTVMHTPRKGLYPGCVKNCEQYQILHFWQMFSFFFFWNEQCKLVVNGEL